MEFGELIKKRHSVRAFLKRPVEREKLTLVLEAANSAPSAGDLQAYEIVVVSEAKGKAALAQAAHGQEFIAEAPVVLVFLANPERSARKYGARGRELYCIQDATIAACFAWLAAVDEGLAAVWVGAFDEGAVRKLLGAPESIRPLALMPLGYAAEEPWPTPRRKLSELAHAEELGK